MFKLSTVFFGILILLGFADSAFLTYEHYSLSNIGCPISPWINCLAVTSSKYSEIFGIPLALLGMVYYAFMFFFLMKKEKMFKHFFLLTSSLGILFSLYLLYIQIFAIGLFCLYCLASATISFLIFGLTWVFNKPEWKSLVLDSVGYAYKYILKPILWMIDAEFVHNHWVKNGKLLLKVGIIRSIFRKIFAKSYRNLNQKVLGAVFKSPIGLAAGFDYEADLMQTLPHIGFGFETVGTLTYDPYEGNPKPRLGRLPKSQSLLVNKGFKNLGVAATIKKIEKLKFIFPVGISIGRTNSRELDNFEKSIEDITKSFRLLKKSKLNNAFYELNISCPNLIHDLGIDFYKPKSLDKLLSAVDKIALKKPLFIKMPIDQTDKHTLAMLTVIEKHKKVAGVIFGNLQTDKKHKSLKAEEVKRFKMGKFSGKPTFEASNRLIRLTYKKYKDRFVIVGTGGVFNAEDAWIKIINGATLVQLITGMIFEGPQLIAQINRDLSDKLTQEGYENISQAVGSAV